ncbi:MAG: response regulator transcription factor, partial [Chloroflexota bacterium]|nr:response regulator transcription factor [Chloroflexota bacterium]
MIRVLVCDDHAISRVGLAYVLESEPDITVVGEAIDGQDAIDKATMLRPDFIVMDLYMPRRTGLEALALISERLPKTKVMMLT